MDYKDLQIAEEGALPIVGGLIGLFVLYNIYCGRRNLAKAAADKNASSTYVYEAIRELEKTGNYLSKCGYKVDYFEIDLGFRKVFKAYKPYMDALTNQYVAQLKIWLDQEKLEEDVTDRLTHPQWSILEDKMLSMNNKIRKICNSLPSSKDTLDKYCGKEIIRTSDINKVKKLLDEFDKLHQYGTIWGAQDLAAEKLNIEPNAPASPIHDGGLLVDSEYVDTEVYDTDDFTIDKFFKVKISKV